MTSKVNNIKLGLLLGILAPFITMALVYLISFPEYNLSELIDFLIRKNVFIKIISLCVIPNMGLFFLFLNKNFFYAASGVLLSTIIFAIFIFVTKFTL